MREIFKVVAVVGKFLPGNAVGGGAGGRRQGRNGLGWLPLVWRFEKS